MSVADARRMSGMGGRAMLHHDAVPVDVFDNIPPRSAKTSNSSQWDSEIPPNEGRYPRGRAGRARHRAARDRRARRNAPTRRGGGSAGPPRKSRRTGLPPAPRLPRRRSPATDRRCRSPSGEIQQEHDLTAAHAASSLIVRIETPSARRFPPCFVEVPASRPRGCGGDAPGRQPGVEVDALFHLAFRDDLRPGATGQRSDVAGGEPVAAIAGAGDLEQLLYPRQRRRVSALPSRRC